MTESIEHFMGRIEASASSIKDDVKDMRSNSENHWKELNKLGHKVTANTTRLGIHSWTLRLIVGALVASGLAVKFL